MDKLVEVEALEVDDDVRLHLALRMLPATRPNAHAAVADADVVPTEWALGDRDVLLIELRFALRFLRRLRRELVEQDAREREVLAEVEEGAQLRRADVDGAELA